MYLERADLYRCVPQLGSAGSLAISHTGYHALFSALRQFAPVHGMIRAFGIKVNHDANRIPSYQEHVNSAADEKCR